MERGSSATVYSHFHVRIPPLFFFYPSPMKTMCGNTVLQGVSSIFTKYSLCLMMLQYVKICFIFIKYIYILLQHTT